MPGQRIRTLAAVLLAATVWSDAATAFCFSFSGGSRNAMERFPPPGLPLFGAAWYPVALPASPFPGPDSLPAPVEEPSPRDTRDPVPAQHIFR
jgi:hypothetical protein